MTHQFIKVADIDKPATVAEASTDGARGFVTQYIPGATVVCAICAESRDIYADGTIGKIITKNVRCTNN